MVLIEVFYIENVVKIRETFSVQGVFKRKVEEVDRFESFVEELLIRDIEIEDRLFLSSIFLGGNEKLSVKLFVQRILISFFGVKFLLITRYVIAAVRKGVYIYFEDDIFRFIGIEKERREWWNEKVKELCEDFQNNMLRGEAIDQRLYEEWRFYKVVKMLEEEKEIIKFIEEIIGKYSDLEAFLGFINIIKE